MIMNISKLKKSEPFEAESIAGVKIFKVINPSSLLQAAFLNRTLSNCLKSARIKILLWPLISILAIP